MAILLDTHILAWALAGDTRLSPAARDALADPDQDLLVSAAVAFEYADLHKRGRFPQEVDFETVSDALALTVLDIPADVWRFIASLPDIHRDPTDRMLIAHAMAADLTLLTADVDIRSYPIRTLW